MRAGSVHAGYALAHLTKGERVDVDRRMRLRHHVGDRPRIAVVA